MAPCNRQVKAKHNLTCSSCDSWVDFVKSRCVNSWAEVQVNDFCFEYKRCNTVKCLQDQINELRQMILMMTGQDEKEESRGGENEESRSGENEESRGGENEESRGGENEDSRGGENEESRGGENEESRGGENEESRGNVRETAGKKTKDGMRQSVQQKESKRVSGQGLSGGKTVEDNERREMEKTVEQKNKDGRRQRDCQVVRQQRLMKVEKDVSKTVKRNGNKMTDGRRQSVQ